MKNVGLLCCLTIMLIGVPGFAQNLVLNGTMDTDIAYWNPSPFGTSDNTVAWDAQDAADSGASGSLLVNVPISSDDNSEVSSAIDGSVQFNGFTTVTAGAELVISSYVFVDTPLTEKAGISNGNGGAAVGLLDGLVDFTGVITPDEDRILDNDAFELLTAPALTLAGDLHSYSTYLFIRNAVGSAYFDDVSVTVPSAVDNWDIY